MKTRIRTIADVKVGLTIFIGMLIFLFLLLMVGTEQNLFSSTYRLNVFVTDIKAVVEGSMVTLGGLKVGRVEKMEFAHRDNKDGIVISLTIRKDYQRSITTSSTAVIKTIGMLGDKYVDISFGETGEPIPENGFIPLRQTFDLSEAADSVQTALNGLTDIIADMKTVTRSITHGQGTVGRLLMDSSLAHDMQRSVRALREITDAVTQRRGTFGRLVYDEQLYARLKGTAENIQSLTDSVRAGSGSLGKLMRDDTLYASMHRLAESLNTIFVRAASDSSSVGSVLNSTELYDRISTLLDDLNELIKEMKADPKKFFHISVF